MSSEQLTKNIKQTQQLQKIYDDNNLELMPILAQAINILMTERIKLIKEINNGN